ncbi:MAG: VirB3 family type IV secretion system protein [Gemmatimonadota bacterium]|nr:VirB3 family type IV secretion system protein [Gemmatimonadota bacterium]
MALDAGPYAAPIHPSLVRPLLYMGVERHVIALEATIGLALVVGVGIHLITLALLAAVILAVHPALVWVTARDPLASEIFLRSRGYADFYAPHASIHDMPRTPRPSIPKAR